MAALAARDNANSRTSSPHSMQGVPGYVLSPEMATAKLFVSDVDVALVVSLLTLGALHRLPNLLTTPSPPPPSPLDFV